MTRSTVDWRRPLVYTHRWLGIAGCVLFIAWFVSGIVMMYARMPILGDGERLAHLERLTLGAARVEPAAAAAGMALGPDEFRIAMLDGRPVYRLASGRGWLTIFADTGESLEPLTESAALRRAAAFAPQHAATLRYDRFLEDADQWTFGVRALMPMHRVALGDPETTDLYISDQTGDVVMKTTRHERVWGYAGAVIHWLYFTPLRRHTAVWTELIIWLSLAGCVLCLSGLVWGAWRYSPAMRYRLKHDQSHTPYAGWMRWHHYAGLIFGLVTFTWIFSGLLSMTPWNWSPGTSPSRQEREAVAGGPLRMDLVTLDRLRAGLAALNGSLVPRELHVLQLAGQPALLADGAQPAGQALVSVAAPDDGVFARFPDDAMVAAARAAGGGASVSDATWLSEYDAYYYDRDRARTLPVLRVRFDDRERTALYLDPVRGAVALKYQRRARLERWIYHGLHSLDFPGLYSQRPLWDAVVIVLSLGGLALSGTTLVPAWRRLRRQAIAKWRSR